MLTSLPGPQTRRTIRAKDACSRYKTVNLSIYAMAWVQHRWIPATRRNGVNTQSSGKEVCGSHLTLSMDCHSRLENDRLSSTDDGLMSAFSRPLICNVPNRCCTCKLTCRCWCYCARQVHGHAPTYELGSSPYRMEKHCSSAAIWSA
jgi:hypothetical protein